MKNPPTALTKTLAHGETLTAGTDEDLSHTDLHTDGVDEVLALGDLLIDGAAADLSRTDLFTDGADELIDGVDEDVAFVDKPTDGGDELTDGADGLTDCLAEDPARGAESLALDELLTHYREK